MGHAWRATVAAAGMLRAAHDRPCIAVAVVLGDLLAVVPSPGSASAGMATMASEVLTMAASSIWCVVFMMMFRSFRCAGWARAGHRKERAPGCAATNTSLYPAVSAPAG